MNSPHPQVAVAAPEKLSAGGRERFVAGLICAWLVIHPWIIGGRFWWTEALNTVVGAVALTAALRSRENWRTLWRFPVFWLGLLFCGYILCQALNPWGYAVQRVPGLLLYDVYTSPHVPWLPSGISGNYFQPCTWRTLVYWLGPWLLVCAWWAAVRRRRTCRLLTLAAFLNGVAMAVLVIFERFHPPEKILGFYTLPGQMVSMQNGSFVDHNKAAAFLYLAMGAGLAVACRLQARARQQARDNGLTWVAFFGCLVILASFFALGSRAGLAIACGVFVGGFMVLLAAGLLAKDRSPGLWLGCAILVTGVIGVGFFEFYNRDTGTLARIEYLNAHPEEDTRAILHRETIHMLQVHRWLGWGGGAYRYVSPDFFREDYVFLDSTYDGGLRSQTDWAHSDWLQLPMEFGFIGAGFLLVILLYIYGRALWLARALGAAGLAVLMACGGMLVHCTEDFPAYNASVLTLFSLLLVSTLKQAELEARHASKA